MDDSPTMSSTPVTSDEAAQSVTRDVSPRVLGIRRERAPRHGTHQGIPIPRPLRHNAMNSMRMVGPEGLEP